MKKAIYLSSIKIWALWVEIPLIAFLAVVINQNPKIEGFIKLYPLMLALVAAIILSIVYFARLVKVSYDEIRAIGPFSGKDSVVINAGKNIKLVKSGFGKVRLEVIGHDVACGLEWMKPEDRIRDISLFKAVVYGGDLAIRSVLDYYGCDSGDFELILGDEMFEKSYQFITVSATINDDGAREINIRIDKTI